MSPVVTPPLADFTDISDYSPSGRGRLTAVLGPTNTGKTHYALERMLAHKSGMIGLPLRLLAREIYDRIVRTRNPAEVALVTGEEKIIPSGARYWVATVEAMPLEREVAFLAVDEVQLAADAERGRVFTSRILHARGTDETLFLGSDTMRPVLQRLFRNIQFIARERFSRLTYSGPKKVTRLPRRSAVVAFSADTVYAIAELIRRQRGGAAVVLGALSPRTRNAQAALYQSGDVDFLVATDAIGMGLNMDIDHVAFAARRKYDGRGPRNLLPAEMAQIAGRAGRHVRDGTFGVTADCPPIDEDMVEAIENHVFDPVAALQWRTEAIDLKNLPALLRSLEKPPPGDVFVRSRREDDEDALARLIADPEIRDLAAGGAALALLWDVCQTPDFRKLSADQHARLLADIYLRLIRDGRLREDFLAPQLNRLDRADGDIDLLSTRLAHIRTWTYLSHRAHWLENAAYWQERARTIEDTISDALHDKLTQRFVDRRTSTLLKRLKDDAPLLAGVTDDGEVIVEGQFIGRLLGFEFIVDPRASGAEAKSLRAAGEKALKPVLAARAAALANAAPDELRLDDDATIWWRQAPVARLAKGPSPLRPTVFVNGLDGITPSMRSRVEERLKTFIAAKIEALLGPLIALQQAAGAESDDGLKGVTRGVAYRLFENFGATSRSLFGEELKQIDQDERGKLRKIGVRFGEYTLHLPALLKPAPASLLLLLWAIWTDRKPGEIPAPKPGLVSIENDEAIPHAFYYAAGYRPSGARAVRIDMLERLAGLIRTARNGADMREGFAATPQMMSLVGCSGEDFEAILRSLGLRKNVVKKRITPDDAASAAADPSNAGENGADVTPEAADADSAPAEEPATGAAGDEPTTPEPTTVNPAETPVVDAAPPETQTADGAAAATTPAAADAEVEEVEVVLWRVAPRKTHQRPKRDARPQGKPEGARGRPPKGAKGPRSGPKSGKGGDRGPKRHQGAPMMHEPRHRKTADPNSPFAVLAGLKNQLQDEKDGGAKKQPEKAE